MFLGEAVWASSLLTHTYVMPCVFHLCISCISFMRFMQLIYALRCVFQCVFASCISACLASVRIPSLCPHQGCSRGWNAGTTWPRTGRADDHHRLGSYQHLIASWNCRHAAVTCTRWNTRKITYVNDTLRTPTAVLRSFLSGTQFNVWVDHWPQHSGSTLDYCAPLTSTQLTCNISPASPC